MDKDKALKRVEELGRIYASDAIFAGGPDPRDDDGGSLLPTEPLPGDFEALVDEIGDELGKDPEILRAFETSYKERIEQGRGFPSFRDRPGGLTYSDEDNNNS